MKMRWFSPIESWQRYVIFSVAALFLVLFSLPILVPVMVEEEALVHHLRQMIGHSRLTSTDTPTGTLYLKCKAHVKWQLQILPNATMA